MKKYSYYLLIISLIAAIGLAAADTSQPSTLDNILNTLIPIACIGLFVMLIYRAFKEPINKGLAWIKEQMAPKEQVQATSSRRYKNTYMLPGDIRYN
jgi:peptidoglycan/LPS O-acetylase OafA/YrhL